MLDHLIAQLIKSAKRLGLSRNDSAYLMAELTLIEAVRDGRGFDTSFEIARSVLCGASVDLSAQRASVAV